MQGIDPMKMEFGIRDDVPAKNAKVSPGRLLAFSLQSK
jgi:hypothetical protein